MIGSGVRWQSWALVAGCIFVSGYCAANAHGTDDWPRWNGPKCEMISGESGWAKDWEASPPKQLWTVELGTGFSSISVIGERIFTMGRNEANDVVYCLNANSGDIVWKYEYECALLANAHEGGPGSTPTVADGRVYTFSREGHVHCLDANDGSLIWKIFLPDITEVKHPMWGLTSSALVLDDKVLLESGRLVALNKNDGELIWQTEIRKAGYGSPMQFVHEGKTLVATLNNDGLLVVDPTDGKEIAFTEWKTNWLTNSTTPIYFDGKLFISTGYGRGCALFQLEQDKLTEVYSSRAMSNHFNNSVFYQGHIYGISGNSTSGKNCKLVCMNAATGESQWTVGGVGCGSLMIADGQIIVLTDNGAMTCGEANPEKFKANGKLEPLTGRCWTVPVLANGHVYCRNAKGKLVCLELVREPAATPSE